MSSPTPEQIRTMTPGIDLDLAVARVDGWTDVRADETGLFCGVPPGGGSRCPVWAYSHNRRYGWGLLAAAGREIDRRGGDDHYWQLRSCGAKVLIYLTALSADGPADLFVVPEQPADDLLGLDFCAACCQAYLLAMYHHLPPDPEKPQP